MIIAGFQKQSLIDYPENISAVVFTQGCNFRCPYCHNPELVVPKYYTPAYKETDILAYIDKYKHLLTAVCITGGEPCLHHTLPDFIAQIKELKLKVKLDTNGSKPQLLQELFSKQMIDFIAMDIKHILTIEAYRKAVGAHLTEATFANILQSIALIKNANIPHEFRTTVAKGLHTIADIKQLKTQFGRAYKIQNFRNENVLNTEFGLRSFSEMELAELKGDACNAKIR